MFLNVRRTLGPNFELPRTSLLSPKPNIEPLKHHQNIELFVPRLIFDQNDSTILPARRGNKMWVNGTRVLGRFVTVPCSDVLFYLNMVLAKILNFLSAWYGKQNHGRE